MTDSFHDIVFPNGGVTVLMMALFSLTVNLFGVPLYLAIIDYEDRINRQSTLLTRLSTAICRIYLCWTPIALVDIFRYKTVTKLVLAMLYNSGQIVKINWFFFADLPQEFSWAHGFAHYTFILSISCSKLYWSYLCLKNLFTSASYEMLRFCLFLKKIWLWPFYGLYLLALVYFLPS